MTQWVENYRESIRAHTMGLLQAQSDMWRARRFNRSGRMTKWRSPHEWWDETDQEWVVGGGVEPKSCDDFGDCVGPHMPCPEQPGVECFGAGCNARGCLRVPGK